MPVGDRPARGGAVGVGPDVHRREHLGQAGRRLRVDVDGQVEVAGRDLGVAVLPQQGEVGVRPGAGHQKSMPRLARTPEAYACLTMRISVTVSARATSSGVAPRPVQ